MHILKQSLHIASLHFEPKDLIRLTRTMAWILCLQGPALTLISRRWIWEKGGLGTNSSDSDVTVD